MQGISGSTADCLADFAVRYPVPQAATLLAEFARVDSLTAVDWLKGIYFPNGSNLLAVRCFLTLCGYTVTEHDVHSGPARQLGQLISFGLMTREDVQAEMSFQYANGVYDVTLRNKGLMPHRQHIMTRLITDNLSELAVTIEMWQVKTKQLEEFASSDAQVIIPQLADESAIPAPHEVLVLDSTSNDPHSDLLTSEALSVMRTRVRTSRPSAQPLNITSSDISKARLVTLLVQAIDEALVDVQDPELLADLILERVSLKKLRTVQKFLYLAYRRS